jgi:hypothetical protein
MPRSTGVARTHGGPNSRSLRSFTSQSPCRRQLSMATTHPHEQRERGRVRHTTRNSISPNDICLRHSPAGLAPNLAGKWRKRFFVESVDGLRDCKRPGLPAPVPAAVVAACKAIACELSATRGVPLAAGDSPSCAPRSWPPAWWRRSQPRRCGAGWRRTRSSRGGTPP